MSSWKYGMIFCVVVVNHIRCGSYVRYDILWVPLGGDLWWDRGVAVKSGNLDLCRGLHGRKLAGETRKVGTSLSSHI